MKITFQTADAGIKTDYTKTQEKAAGISRIGEKKSYAAVFSKDSGMEVYQEQGKDTKDIMQEAQGKDVAMTRNYMAVMAGSMSSEDFAQLQEQGYDTGNTDVEKTVTIVDKIKASMLEAGVTIAGYTDTLDMDTLTEITGSQTLAREMTEAFSAEGVPLTAENAKKTVQALQEAKRLTAPTEETLEYMIKNDMEPALSELYMAQYSSREGAKSSGGYYRQENGYLAKQPENINWESLSAQIEKVLSQAGLADTPGAVEAAEKLISGGIPLTGETLHAYLKLEKIRLPEEKELLLAMAAAVSDGKEPAAADLTGAPSLWEQAGQLWERTNALTGEAADVAADMASEKGRPLTLAGILAAQTLLENGYQNLSGENITARRQLEEVRLQMTILANRELLKSGYAIETQELEKVVEALRNAEYEKNRILFGSSEEAVCAERAELYTETVQNTEGLAQLPLAVVGKVCGTTDHINLKQVNKEGQALAAAYKKAGESYEQLWTAPRRDMGDSIRKAFSNTDMDGLLEELGLEATEANKRALRILGYNSMELTVENITEVKAADQALRSVAAKLTPAAALHMIREGKNPLELSLDELEHYLDKTGEAPEQEQEKYAKFLYKLEQQKEITQEEKESYIGIYRLLRQVEKSDGAVIGQLVHQGAAISFKNLLQAVRTSRAGGLDTTVDDSFGVLQEVNRSEKGIDEQITAAYYKGLCREAYREADGDKLIQIKPGPETELEEFTELLRRTEPWQETEAAYRKQQTDAYRQIAGAKEQSLELLRMLEEPVTPENILAAEEYRRDSQWAFKKIRKEADKYNIGQENSFSSELSMLEENFESREEAGNAYKRLTEAEQGLLEAAMYETEEISYLDVKELGLAYKQVGFMAGLAGQEQYEIPLLTEDSVVALHLKVVHSGEEAGMVEAAMETPENGRVSIKLQLQENRVMGFFIGSTKESGELLKGIMEGLTKELPKIGVSAEEMQLGFRKEQGSISTFSGRAETKPHTSTKTLYRVAKAAIGEIRRQTERSFAL